MNKIIDNIKEKIQTLPLSDTLQMRAFSLARIPLLFLTSPRVLEVSNERCEVVLPLRKIVKNHLGSMYFGALAIGADTCVGFLAFDKIKKSKKNIQLIFKDFHADFLKRAEGDVHFICEQGEVMDRLVEQVISTGERVNQPIEAYALVGSEKVATFVLTLSLKLK